jgi:hypothetical protein
VEEGHFAEWRFEIEIGCVDGLTREVYNEAIGETKEIGIM